MLILEFLTTIVNAVDVGPADVQFGFVMFSEFSVNEFFLDTYRTKAEVIAAIIALEDNYMGSHTNTSGTYSQMKMLIVDLVQKGELSI